MAFMSRAAKVRASGFLMQSLAGQKPPREADIPRLDDLAQIAPRHKNSLLVAHFCRASFALAFPRNWVKDPQADMLIGSQDEDVLAQAKKTPHRGRHPVAKLFTSSSSLYCIFRWKKWV